MIITNGKPFIKTHLRLVHPLQTLCLAATVPALLSGTGAAHLAELYCPVPAACLSCGRARRRKTMMNTAIDAYPRRTSEAFFGADAMLPKTLTCNRGRSEVCCWWAEVYLDGSRLLHKWLSHERESATGTVHLSKSVTAIGN